MVMATLTMKVMSEAVGRCRSGYRLRTGVVAMTSQYHTMRNVCETPREQRTKTTGVQLRWTAATHQRRWAEREIYTKDCRVIEVMCRVLRQKKGEDRSPLPFSQMILQSSRFALKSTIMSLTSVVHRATMRLSSSVK